MKNKRLPLLAALIVIVLAVFFLVTKECEHKWQPATCHAPETCSICKEKQGEPLAHVWADATCHAPQTCTLCGDTQGKALAHVFAAATCHAPQTCTLCGDTQGEPLAHVFADATCHVPQTCTLCGDTQGEPLAHIFADATCHVPQTCTLCGDTQGDVLAHIFADATCHAPQTCTLCGDTQGEVLAHVFADATCHAPQTCTLCGDTQGEPLTHVFVDATCHAPQTCTLCGDTQGEPLAHQWQSATCTTLETCALCGDTQGELAAHTWESTSCAAPAPCTVCGTLEGIELTHEWAENRRICQLCQADERTIDEQFMDSVAAGLEASWALTRADLEAARAAAEAEGKLKSFIPKLTRERLQECIQIEFEHVIDYRGKTFENDLFGEWAQAYIDGVLTSQVEIEALDETINLVDQYARDGYHMQSIALYFLNEMVPINMSEESQEDLKSMLLNGEAISKVSDLMEKIAFQNVSTLADGRDRFEAFVTNDTGLRFAKFSFDVNLYDGDNNLLTTKTLSVEDWRPGEKQRFAFFTVQGTRKMQLMFANWMFPGGETSDAQMEEAAE